MDLNSQVKSSKKLHSYLQSLLDNDVRLYSKSKDKLVEMRDHLQESLSVLDALIEDPVEEVSKDINLSESKKDAIACYSRCLSNLNKTNHSISRVAGCIDIIWRWFRCRILTPHDASGPFYYNIEMIPNIIYLLVVTYGKALKTDDVDSYMERFDKWVDSLDKDPQSNRWIAPYEIYSLEKGGLSPSDVNLESVVLWDILIDSGLRELCDKSCKLPWYLKENWVWDITESKNSSELDRYVNYQDDPGILEKLNIV